jgi:hypothetical protein
LKRKIGVAIRTFFGHMDLGFFFAVTFCGHGNTSPLQLS